MVAKITIKGNLPISKIAVSGEMLAQLEPFARQVLDAAKHDPNETYVASLRMKSFLSHGKLARVSWQVGAAPTIGRRIEAKRSVFSRIVSSMGFAAKGRR